MLQPLRGMTYRFIIPEALPGLCAAAPCLSFQPATSGSAGNIWFSRCALTPLHPRGVAPGCALLSLQGVLKLCDYSLIELAQLILPYYI